MSVIYAPESRMGQERQKFEQHQYNGHLPPGNPYQFREYPKMVFKAGTSEAGPIEILERHTVDNDVEEGNMLSRGFFPTQEKAIEEFKKSQREVAKQAANRNFHERRMSAGAKAERDAAEQDAGGEHLGEIPTKPVQRRRDKATGKAEKLGKRR